MTARALGAASQRRSEPAPHAPVRSPGPAAWLPFHRPSIGDEEIAAVVDSLRSGWLTTGPKTAEFEHAFAARMAVTDRRAELRLEQMFTLTAHDEARDRSGPRFGAAICPGRRGAAGAGCALHEQVAWRGDHEELLRRHAAVDRGARAQADACADSIRAQ